MQEDRSSARSGLSLPGAVIIAGAIIAIALIWTQRPAGSSFSSTSVPPPVAIPGAADGMAPVTASDHILGNPNAPIKLVEYSDPSCPFCKMFNPTMARIMSEYGPGGNVAWVYRQFPLDKPDQSGKLFHPNSGREAIGLECAASLGGNTAFFAYEKDWFDNLPDTAAERSAEAAKAQILETAKNAGLDAAAFAECIASGRFEDKLDKEYTDGINAGVTGTPYTVIITPSGSKIPLEGAATYATLKRTLDTLIAQLPPAGAQTQTTSPSSTP